MRSPPKTLLWLAPVAMLFGTSMILFPHYQALGLEQWDLPLHNLVPWLIVQNAGVALFSLVAGPLADRRGNRRVVHRRPTVATDQGLSRHAH